MTRTRLATVAAFAAVLLLAGIALAWGQNTTPRTGQVVVVATTTPAASTTTIVQAPAVTGPGPESFTTLAVKGPVQVLVVHLSCVRYAGDGWQVTWRISNQERQRTGAVLAQVDDAEPVTLAANLTLRAGQTTEATQTVTGQGESVVVTWANASRPVQSFPLELPGCPVDPADERAARQATTTT